MGKTGNDVISDKSKIMKKLILAAVALFIFSFNTYALKISFTAGECFNPADDNITQSTSKQIESVYYLFEDQRPLHNPKNFAVVEIETSR